MKKFVVLSLLMLMGLSACAEFIMAPEWSEFCPVEYLSAKPSKFNKNTDYWYNRRTQFNEAVARCNSYTGNDLKSCYEHIRLSEQNKNKVWENRVEQQRIESQKSTELYNRMQTFNAINHLIDTIGK